MTALAQTPKSTTNKYTSPTRDTEEYMNENQLQHFKTKLTSHQAALQEQISQGINDLKNNEKVADPADAASQNEDLILTLNKQDEAKRELVKVQRGLRLIKEGDYGFCITCGVEIGIDRLDAKPTSIRCIDCASLEEIKNNTTLYRAAHIG